MRPQLHIARVAVLLPMVATHLFAQTEPVREIGRTTEREVNVVLSSAIGTVSIGRGTGERVLLVVPGRESDMARSNITYTVRNRVGYLDIALGEEARQEEGRRRGVKVSGGIERGRWELLFSDALPVSFDIELGLGKGTFDFSGLRVRDFNLTSGASDVYVTFNEPNITDIENISIESGVSKFVGENLGNANFKRFQFRGGVGTYTLDFSGTALRNEVDVDVKVGLGSLTIIIPWEIGARIHHSNSWVSRFSADRDFRKVEGSQHISENYATADGRMNIRIDAGMGSVRVRRK